MRIDNLVKTYKHKSGNVEALKGVSFDLHDKGMVFILGKSGCGKSTLLNVLSGMDNFDSGDVIYKGKNLKNLSKTELDSYRNSCCGFIFQEYNLIPELNVYDNIALAIEMQGINDVAQKVSLALEKVGLSGYEQRKVNELSGGQKQRIAIARSIVKDPQIIFADEPSGALDSATGEIVFNLLKELSKDRLVIVVSHDREFAEKYGERIIELNDGKVFSDTNAQFIEERSNEALTLKRAKMPLRSAFKVGCSNYKFHPIRMVATILLALFSFTFLGVSLAMATINKANPYVNAIYENEYEYLTIKKYLSVPIDSIEVPWESEGFAIEDLFVKNDYTYQHATITSEDIEILQKYTSEDLLTVGLDQNSIFTFKNFVREWDDEFSLFIEQSNERYTSMVNGCITISEEVIRQNDYELVGSLPKNVNEVVIGEQHYNVLKYLGYKDKDGNEYEINSMEDVIGCSISHSITSDLIITGVIKTGCDTACYNENHKEEIIINPETGMVVKPNPYNNPDYFTLQKEYLFHDKLFVTQEYLTMMIEEVWDYTLDSYVVFRVPQDKKEFKALVKFIASFDYGTYKSGVFYELAENDPTTLWYNTAMRNAMPLKVLVLYIGVIFFIFALVLLLNLITTSVRSQMKQIGIISALGADFKQLYKIYLIGALVLCGIVYLLSLVSVGIIIEWFNSMGWRNLWFNMGGNSFNLLSLNIITIVVLFGVSVISALLGSILALRKMRKLSSAEIIRRGLIK